MDIFVYVTKHIDFLEVYCSTYICILILLKRGLFAPCLYFFKELFCTEKKVKECEYKNVDECIETGWIMHGVWWRGMRVHKL
jgi:hypothetical protein